MVLLDRIDPLLVYDFFKGGGGLKKLNKKYIYNLTVLMEIQSFLKTIN